MDVTPRLALPLLSVGQAQKELVHNLALASLDAVVACAVEDLPANAPPTAPTGGACYIVGAAPTGDWASHAQSLAAYTSGGWQFISPQEGMAAYVRSASVSATYRAGAWELGQLRASTLILGGQQVAGARQPAIASPSGGSVVDAEARTAVGQILAAMREHGLIES